MTRIRVLLVALATCASVAFAGAGTAAAGTIVFDGSPGAGAPPAKLGPYAMTAFAQDPAGERTYAGAVTGPTGDVGFAPSLYHVRVPTSWQTWSHGYTGDVYWSLGTSVTLTLPDKTSAFYFYAEPDPFAVFTISATAQDGTTSGPIAVEGYAGAQYYGFYGTGGDHVASITVSSNVDFAIGEFGINAPHRNYVALGDSYSSGEGAPPFFAGTNGGGDFCHRSVNAYSQVIGAHYGMTPKFYACSGAVTSDITSTFHQGEPPQITRPGVDTTADLLTMTIGGNDAGFSDTLKACIGQKLKADVINAAIGPVGRWLGLGKDPSCVHSDSFTASVNTHINNVFWPVKSTYLSLLSATDSKNTSIVVGDYPRLFPVDHGDQDCLALKFILTHDDMDWMNGAGDRLDALLQQAAGEAGVNFVDARNTFAGHEVCGPAGAYINGLSMASGNGGACTWSVFGKCIIPGIPVVGSFHPNATGQANGYGAAFISYIDGAPEKTNAGFPANPFPLPDPPSTTAIPPVGFGDLAAHPVAGSSDDCAGTFQAGQLVSVAADGFSPGTAVELYASSAGFGSQAEVKIGDATADSTGHVATTVRVPLAAAGFKPDGSPVGLVVLDAIGLGSGADHYDAVALVGLAGHDAACGSIDPLPFSGFGPPVSSVNAAQPGRAVPVKFSIAGSNGTLASVVADGYPQSASVSCSAPESPTTGDPTATNAEASSEPSDDYNYVWKTDKSWRGCRALIVKLVDGSYHRAVFDFGK